MQYLHFLFEITLAMLLGAAIGLERQWRQRLAGLRTNALVALGAAAFVELGTIAAGGVTIADRMRIAAQVVSGIGFLGGGLILKERFNVRGLNTAATLWCSAAVGTLAGMGALLPATLAGAVVLGTNIALRPIVYHFNRQPVAQAEVVEICYQIDISCRVRAEARIRHSLLQESAGGGLLLKSLRREMLENEARVHLMAEVITHGRNDPLIERIAIRLGLESGISAIAWIVHQHPECV
jgi:putative Mg2+ transporter-C (MgtC) family protein